LTTRESGIYSHWSKEILRVSGFKGDINGVVKYDLYKHENLSLFFLSDVFYLLFFGILISIIVIVIEYLIVILSIKFKPIYKTKKLSDRRVPNSQYLMYYNSFNRNTSNYAEHVDFKYP